MDELLNTRKQAEAAVSDMKDPDMKAAAFQVILQHLLSRSEAPRNSSNSDSRPGSRKEASGSGTMTEDERPPESTAERILLLKNEGFLDPGRGIGEIRDELQAHGWMYALTALSGPLRQLVRRRELRRVQFHEGKKKTFKYFKP